MSYSKSAEIEKVENGYVVHYRAGDIRSVGEYNHTKVYTNLTDVSLDIERFLEKNE